MVDRKREQAAEDATGVDDVQGDPAQTEGNPYGFNDEEAKAWADMQNGPQAVIDDGSQGEDDPDAGMTGRDVNADAAKAAEALAGQQGDPQADPNAPQADPKAAAADDDDDDSDPTDGGKHPQRVNYQKFARAREKARTAETELQKEREARQRLDERYKMIVEALQTGAAPQQQPGAAAQPKADELGPMPDPKEDIFAFAEWQAKKIAQLETGINETRTSIQTRQADNDLNTHYRRDIDTFSSTTKDFPQAYEFMMATRAVELAATNFGVDLTAGEKLSPEQVGALEKQILFEERQLLQMAFENKQSPAKQLYIMAKARGYRPAAAAQPDAKTPANGAAKPNGNGSGKPTVSDAVRAAKNGVATNATLSAGGGAPETQLTADQVANMSNEEFAHFMETSSDDQKRAVFGA